MTPARDISDGVCAYLQGGFGNQLFILAAAWEQADRLGCPLYVDTSRFLAGDPLERAKETPRSYELAAIGHPGILIGEDSPWYRNSPRRPAPIRVPFRGAHRLSVFRQPTLGYHPEVDDVKPGTTLLGYFQSWRYFDRVSDSLAAALGSADLTEAERRGIAAAGAEPSITAHVRRGDYLTPAAALHHGIAGADYFRRGLSLLRELRPSLPVRVYSDSPDIVRAELAGLERLEFVDDTDSLGSLATVLAMSSGVAFAMSNSSFSWWAAWLMSRRDANAPVVAPRPWQADGQSGHDQLLPDWLTLDAR